MNNKTLYTFLVLILFFVLSCKEKSSTIIKNVSNQDQTIELEKQAILNVLNSETKAAFNRDYDSWKEYWIHEDYVTKTYMNFADSSLTETLGWNEINQFVKTYIEEHPEPAPLPSMIDNIALRLYENGAWVSYEQHDPSFGFKRENRLMEKVNGSWKIAGMQTTIYGFAKRD